MRPPGSHRCRIPSRTASCLRTSSTSADASPGHTARRLLHLCRSVCKATSLDAAVGGLVRGLIPPRLAKHRGQPLWRPPITAEAGYGQIFTLRGRVSRSEPRSVSDSSISGDCARTAARPKVTRTIFFLLISRVLSNTKTGALLWWQTKKSPFSRRPYFLHSTNPIEARLPA